MAVENIKNPSVTEEALALQTDDSGYIVSISGHQIAGGGGTGDYSAGTDLKIENNIISVDTNGNPNNTASNTRNFVEGSWTVASGYNSHAEGMATSAYGYAVHAQGMWTKFSSSKWSDTEHPTPVDIYWAAGAGATVEGYCNATTSCPMSGTKGQSDYGPIHGGIIKVIGNGNVVHDKSVDPDAHIHTLQPSDALIIFKDGCISAAGNISANGVELGAGGGTSYQGRNGVNVDGSNIELTTSAYEYVTSVPNISNDVTTLKNASANWNKVSDKLDTTAFSTVSGNFLTEEVLDEYAKLEQLEIVSGELLTTAQYANDSARFLTAVPDAYALKTDIPKTVAQLTDSGNYYLKTETSSKTEIENAFDNIPKYILNGDSNITATSAQDGKNIRWDLSVNASPVVTDTTLTGENGIYTHTTTKSGEWCVELVQSAYDAINDVQNKLDTTAAAQTYQPKGNYVSSTDITDMATKTWVGEQQYLTEVPSEYVTNTELQTTLGSYATNTLVQNTSAAITALIPSTAGLASETDLQIVSAGVNAVSGELPNYLKVTAYEADSGKFALKSEIPTVPTKVSDLTDSANYYKTTETSGAAEISTALGNKVDKPTSLVNKYLVLRTDNAGDVSGWYDLTDQYYNKDQANTRFVATANIDSTTLSGNGNSPNRKLGVNTDVIATKDYVDSGFLPTSGGTVTGDVIVKSTGNNILAVNTTATLMGQSRVNSLTDTSAIGTNWLGVNSLGGGFLKNVQGGDVGALNGTSIQINFAPDGNNSYGNITVNSQGNESKVVHVPTASYTNMSTFDSENGPNYMLRKTANGFDIGAAVINTTELPANVQANAYYFIYEM